MATSCDKESVRQAYESVRDDKTEVNWAVLKYDGNKIVVASTGSDYHEFLSNFNSTFFKIYFSAFSEQFYKIPKGSLAI